MSESRRRVSYNQLLHLWEFLNDHKDIAVGYNKSLQARDHSRKMWDIAANILNALGEGANKSGPEWSKYWIDLKAKLKRKNRLINDSRQKTGGGPSTDIELSEIDRKFLYIVEDYGFGLAGVQVDPLAPHEYQNNPISNVASASPTSYDTPVANLLPSPSRRGAIGRVTSSLVSSETNLPHSPRQSTSIQSPRRRLEFSVEADAMQSQRQGTTMQGPRRRRRRQRQMSAAEARERLVNVSETRAQAEIAKSQAIERGVHILDRIATILSNIYNR